MTRAPSYWSLAARTLPPAESILNPSPILFRPENGPVASEDVATENPNAATHSAKLAPVENETPFRPMIESTIELNPMARLSNEPDRKREIIFSDATPIGIGQTDQHRPIDVQRPNIEMQPDHFSPPRIRELVHDGGESKTTTVLKSPAKSIESPISGALPVSTPQITQANDSNLVGRELPSLLPTLRVETGRVTAVEISKSMSEPIGKAVGKQDTLPRLHPPPTHSDLQIDTYIDKSPHENFSLDASKSNVSPIQAGQANESKPELRIGSIVVHVEKPTPPVAQRPSAPTVAKPSGTLTRGFSSFGFHQN